MRVLVLNSGSSSIKFQLIESDKGAVLFKGICERVGDKNSVYSAENVIKGEKVKEELYFENHLKAIEKVLALIVDEKIGVLNSLDEIDAIGHRVVHGGEYFSESVVVDEKVLEKIELVSALAPLHNPANIKGIKVCQELMPGKKNIAVFDTAFHQTMEKEKYIYAIPYVDYEELKIRKYGFHGTSFRYIAKQMEKLLNTKESKIIVCHLGNGASICAIKNGKSIDTSMGFTPLAGIPMGTRSGDVDPAIIEYIAKARNLSTEEAVSYLNKKSGMLGVCGSSDNRDITMKMFDGDERSKLALDIFCNKIASYIGSYFVELGGLDAIVFTGGIGENSNETREFVCDRLEALGVKLNKEVNNVRTKDDVLLSTEDSKVKVYKVSTNEELMIAIDTENLLK